MVCIDHVQLCDQYRLKNQISIGYEIFRSSLAEATTATYIDLTTTNPPIQGTIFRSSLAEVTTVTHIGEFCPSVTYIDNIATNSPI